MTVFREGGLFAHSPLHPGAAPKVTILNRVNYFEDLKNLNYFEHFERKWLSLASGALFILKLYKASQTTLCK